MSDFQVSDILNPGAMANLLVDYCLDVQKGQQVVIRSTTLAAPLLLELQRAVMERDAWPLLHVELPGQVAGSYRHARDIHLDGVAPISLEEARQADCVLSIQAPDDAHALAGIDPAVISRAARGRHAVREQTMNKRWATTIWPTEALAARSGMELSELTALVAKATFLEVADPVGAWSALREFQDRLIKRLEGVQELRIEAEGTDLRLRVGGRSWVNSDGKRNMPSGEVFTGPWEDSATGTIRFTVPSSPAGVAVEDVQLTFHRGEVIHATAVGGQDYLEQALATDEGSRKLGEVGIGTNFGINQTTGVILMDEKIGGTVHVALGSSYPETGGTNASALHWDLICDLREGGRLSADGQVIQENGRFVGV